jgi:hypothetical protein
MSDETARLLSSVAVRFARSATRHRVRKDDIRHVIANYSVRFEEPPPGSQPGARTARIVHLGKDPKGQVLEVMVIELANQNLLVIHAMPLRAKYKQRYEEAEK